MEAMLKFDKRNIPPLLDDLDEEVKGFLLKPENLPIHRWERSQLIWPRKSDVLSLLDYKSIPVQSSIKPIRDHSNGQIISWRESVTSSRISREDMSLRRPPLPPQLATRGLATQLPFLPAGFEDEQVQQRLLFQNKMAADSEIGDTGETFLGEKLLCVVPMLQNGLKFATDGVTLAGSQANAPAASSNPAPVEDNSLTAEDLNSIVEKENHLLGLWTETDDEVNKREAKTDSSATVVSSQEESFLDECLAEEVNPVPDIGVLKISEPDPRSLRLPQTEWAEMLDVSKPIEDFHLLVPNMAHNFPFELDTFQKQAILKLEDQGHVFVAAHTSAGKTVVAEYAIALSRKHCTRTVYTSPIKALSNQKYRDFLRTFGDVGLLTGDLQINTTASCLVMTTEILRSMLYHGSDVVRDLEYVVFDEVHYINNAERGYVWEEVLILLPPHVSIVMLSATVPNTMEFADWVGRIKKRKVYVVSTLKRPVPLCHYLYTGSSGSSKNERFLIINQDNVFIQREYDRAVEAKKKRQSKFSHDYGPKGPRNFLNPNQEKTMWVAFIDHLQKDNKLPVVVFILSRNRCDKTAEALKSIDLTTAREKSRIHCFIKSCLKRLKEPDQKLPQVMTMQALLSCGIGIHHSGILPILKEIVEMLFQSGLVKILFATETFAMGVNMPARTVVFDSTSKFDGLEVRALLPAEYIQMAGRAGRRGLDDTGAVIILCKKDVPSSYSLKDMMQGKPMKLSSQFRITYSTMLCLLRATSVSVEGMMQRSFREAHQQLKADSYKRQLQEIEKLLEEQAERPLQPHQAALAQFHDLAADYMTEMADLMPLLLSQPKNLKQLMPGRVLIICCGKYINQAAVYLNFQGPKAAPFKVLVLTTSEVMARDEVSLPVDRNETWYFMLGLAEGLERVGSQETTLQHTVLCISAHNIIGITHKIVNADIPLVVQDYELQQLPRFRKNSVPDRLKRALVQLTQISFNFYSGVTPLEFVNLKDGLVIYDGEILNSIERICALSDAINKTRRDLNIANFEKEFCEVFKKKQMERECVKIKRMLSYEGLALYPDYLRRLHVLRELRYVDEQNCVAMKGRVACEMKRNELIITELVFRNILSDLDPAEIAALLSSLVFQDRSQTQPNIEPKLQEAIKKIEAVNDELTSVEKKYMVGMDDPACLADRVNFGLTQVVYDWAKGKPFSEIANITDIQEGVIVRNIQQLHEVLTNVRDAAKIIGDPILQAKMDEASVAIKRDIVFFISLYTQDDVNEI